MAGERARLRPEILAVSWRLRRWREARSLNSASAAAGLGADTGVSELGLDGEVARGSFSLPLLVLLCSGADGVLVRAGALRLRLLNGLIFRGITAIG